MVYSYFSLDKAEITNIDRFLDEVTGRWKKVSGEIKSVRAMLEEVIISWKRYSAFVDVLTVWLTQGEQVMMQSLEAKEVSHLISRMYLFCYL